MKIEVYSLEQSYQWDKIVKSFENYDTYWLSGYVKAFEIHGDGCPLLLFYNDQEVRAINVVMKRDISTDEHFIGKIEKGEYFDISTPYGYGGWLIEGDKIKNLFVEYEKWCIENGVVAEFIRFHPVIENHNKCIDFYDVVPLGMTIIVDLVSDDIIWNNIKSQNRNMIRKARKNGVKIYSGRSPELMKKFEIIYNETMKRNYADLYYYFEDEFYNSIVNDLPYNAQLFYAELEGEIISAAIMLMANGMVNYHLSGTNRKYSGLAPTNLLLYESAMWASENGYKTLYLGGGVGSEKDSLYKFKKSFNKNDDDERRFYIGRKIFNQEAYEKLCNLRIDESSVCDNSNFFPKYRAK